MMKQKSDLIPLIRKRVLFVILTFFLCSFLTAREWTNEFTGKRVEAELVEVSEDGKFVVLRRFDNRNFKLRVRFFSKEDREYIKKSQAGHLDEPSTADKSKPKQSTKNVMEFVASPFQKDKISAKVDRIIDGILNKSKENATPPEAQDQKENAIFPARKCWCPSIKSYCAVYTGTWKMKKDNKEITGKISLQFVSFDPKNPKKFTGYFFDPEFMNCRQSVEGIMESNNSCKLTSLTFSGLDRKDFRSDTHKIILNSQYQIRTYSLKLENNVLSCTREDGLKMTLTPIEPDQYLSQLRAFLKKDLMELHLLQTAITPDSRIIYPNKTKPQMTAFYFGTWSSPDGETGKLGLIIEEFAENGTLFGSLIDPDSQIEKSEITNDPSPSLKAFPISGWLVKRDFTGTTFRDSDLFDRRLMVLLNWRTNNEYNDHHTPTLKKFFRSQGSDATWKEKLKITFKVTDTGLKGDMEDGTVLILNHMIAQNEP